MSDLVEKAISSASSSLLSYCKFLSPNDTKATGGHQSGYLIGINSWRMFLVSMPLRSELKKLRIKVKWQDNFDTDSMITYYGSKNEFRITRFGRGFPFLEEDLVGSLFVLSKFDDTNYEAYVLESDEDIEDFFAAFGISSLESNSIIEKRIAPTSEQSLLHCFNKFMASLSIDFPSAVDMAKNSRNCYNSAFNIRTSQIVEDPDWALVKWVSAEYQLFKTLENDRYSTQIKSLFPNVDDLIRFANSILNRRKSRAGKSLELHLAEIFNILGLKYSSQKVTEENKTPDFIFPDIMSYRNQSFSSKRLVFLASKTTCKDRWRQILNEADRIETKHLFTLQQGISSNQLKEMYKNGVQLVVPKMYLNSFPKEFREKILTLNSFTTYVKGTQLV